MARGSKQLDRIRLQQRLRVALRRGPAAILLGPRQCGKTTLARAHVAPSDPVLGRDIRPASMRPE